MEQHNARSLLETGHTQLRRGVRRGSGHLAGKRGKTEETPLKAVENIPGLGGRSLGGGRGVETGKVSTVLDQKD